MRGKSDWTAQRAKNSSVRKTLRLLARPYGCLMEPFMQRTLERGQVLKKRPCVCLSHWELGVTLRHTDKNVK